MKVLVVDVGGRHVKILATGQDAPRQFDSGPTLTPGQMAALAQRISSDLGLRCSVHRLSGAALARAADIGAAQSWTGMGWFRF